MDNLVILKESRKDASYSFIDLNSASTSPNYQDYRLKCIKAAELAGVQPVTGQQFLSNRRTGKNSFLLRKIL